MGQILGSTLLLVLAIIFWIFKPYKLIAGMTFCTKEETQKYNTDRMCNILSIFLVVLAIIMGVVPLINNSPLIIIAIIAPLIISLIILLNSKFVLK